ncbi:hypothetical protein B0H19DRAFT_386402 [Mycena capillaripes]|nr:hypothetical protein B0H19DRAFT_386402 [Mycena capillaripes]
MAASVSSGWNTATLRSSIARPDRDSLSPVFQTSIRETFIYPDTSHKDPTRHSVRANLSAGSQLLPVLDARLPSSLMLASPLHQPWPERTAAPSPPLVEPHASTSKTPRQNIADQAAVDAAKERCEFQSGNEVISCFPTADVVVAQHEWVAFVWNSNNPDFLQTERVDIYLFHGDSLEQILFFPNEVNPTGHAGSISKQVNDTWWGSRGADWAGTNISYPFYWLISRAGEPLSDGSQQPQATFSAVQTTFADSVLASMASSSASSARSVSAASLTATLGSPTITLTLSPSTVQVPSVTPNKGVQSNASGSSFPHWAIVVTVLGIVFVVAVCGLMVLAIYYIRGEKRAHVRSRSPDMAEADEGAPVAAAAVAAGGLARDTSGATSHGHAATERTIPPAQRAISPDSTHSRAEPRPFSGSDAAIMANAFRAELRQPPGRSFDEEDGDDEGPGVVARGRSPDRPHPERESLLRRQLGSEGADIRSVDSVRGVRVESSEGHERSPRASL